MARKSRRRLPAGNKRGATALEYGIILPALLLFLLGIMDAGRLLWNYTTLYRAAEAAARCAAVNAAVCGTASQIQNSAAAQAWGMTVSPVCSASRTPPAACR